jgi:hypothetical protein
LIVDEGGWGGTIVGPCSIRAPVVSWRRRGILRILFLWFELLRLRGIVSVIWAVAHIYTREVLEICDGLNGRFHTLATNRSGS